MRVGQVPTLREGMECGATTAIGTQVSILPSTASLPNKSGNIFIADSDHGRVPEGAKGELNVRVKWRSDDRLFVTYPTGARLFRSENTLGQIHIEYQAVTGDR